ncbi:hypothetical protein [Aeromonas veronii]|uniref:hypothetical protein n=1 Tax=Aeromonas veronii TaxID=654 RepID=UPI0024430218|nr:hypothetical protein [Aeromonas veronii]
MGTTPPYSCDIKETLSARSNAKTYTLVNLAEASAESFNDCAPDDMAAAITHRYTTISYDANDLSYVTQFIYNRQAGAFSFLNDWVGLEGQLSTLNMGELTAALEALPYQYDEPSQDPDAASWVKSMTASENGNTIRTSYDSNGLYQKQTTYADGTHSLECGTDGINWGTCQ